MHLSSFPTTENKAKEEHYSEIVLPQLDSDGTIKMDSNPSYGSYTEPGSTISYGVNKAAKKQTEDQHVYDQPAMHPAQEEHYTYMESNQSHGVIRGESNHKTDFDVIMESNPSYAVAKRMEINPKIALGSDAPINPDPVYENIKAKQ